ncbi:Nn.00g007860.m01.CDS01 [Neocucurbitaria sp. VM-36]
MSSILATTLFVTYAAAQLTTSVWLPGAANADQNFVGSVIEQNGDHTTLSLAFADGPAETPDYYRSAPDTVTIGGTTFVAYEATAVDPLGESDQTITVSLECSRAEAKAVPTCTMSTIGAEAVVSELCAGLSIQSHATPVEGQEYCTDSSALTFDQTLTLSGESQAYLNNFPLTITAGEDKLGASAAATPTASSASITGSASARASGSGSGSGTAAVTGSSATFSGSSGTAPQQTTNAAAPMRSMKPALAGLGAAAAALFL